MFFYKQSKFRKQAGFRLKICLHYAYSLKILLGACFNESKQAQWHS